MDRFGVNGALLTQVDGEEEWGNWKQKLHGKWINKIKYKNVYNSKMENIQTSYAIQFYYFMLFEF